MMMGSSAGLLLAAVAGYWVMERAERHKSGLKTVGKVLGAVIIVVSLLGVACAAWCGGKSCGHGKGMMMKGMCPLMGGGPASSLGNP